MNLKALQKLKILGKEKEKKKEEEKKMYCNIQYWNTFILKAIVEDETKRIVSHHKNNFNLWFI